MATVSIRNLTRPGNTDFYAGERWKISITGAAPGQPVTCRATINNVEVGTTYYGDTDASGNYSRLGTMGREDVALWGQTWMVAEIQILPTLQFRVRTAPISPSEKPVEIPEGIWEWGMSYTPMPTDIFVSDDGLTVAVPIDLTMGVVGVESWAVPWNISSISVGARLPARRRVFAY